MCACGGGRPGVTVVLNGALKTKSGDSSQTLTKKLLVMGWGQSSWRPLPTYFIGHFLSAPLDECLHDTLGVWLYGHGLGPTDQGSAPATGEGGSTDRHVTLTSAHWSK